MCTFKKHIRKLKIDLLNNSDTIIFDSNKLFSTFDIFKPNNRKIKWLLKNNSILTGSRFLKCLKINDSQILFDKTNDWDFIVSEELMIKFCKKFNINYNILKSNVRINGSLLTTHCTYGGITHYFPNHIDILIDNDKYNKLFNMSNKIQHDTMLNVLDFKLKRLSNKDKIHLNNILLNYKKSKL